MASVVVVQHAFTSFYDTQVLLDLLDLLDLLLSASGLGSRGSVQTGSRCMCRDFSGASRRSPATRRSILSRLATSGVDLIGIDPSMTMTYRSEYAQALPGRDSSPRVHLVQEWLAAKSSACREATASREDFLSPTPTARSARRQRKRSSAWRSGVRGRRARPLRSCPPAAAGWREPMATRPSIERCRSISTV